MNVPKHYNETSLTFNFHCLTHLASDALMYGSLENISAFKFENKLGNLKRLLKKKNHISAQLYNRLVEQSLNNLQFDEFVNSEKWTKAFVQSKYLYLSISSPNNFYSVGQEIFKVSTIECQGSQRVFGKKVLNLQLMFHKPLKSSYLNIWETTNLSLSESTQEHFLHQINKITCFFNENKIGFLPLIHHV